MKKYISKIWELYKPFRKTIVFLFALILIVQAIQLLPPIIYAKLVDSVFLKNSLQKSLYLVVYVFLLEMATIIIFQIKGRMELKYTDFDIERHIYNKNLDKILKFSIGQNENDNSGIKQSVLDRGTNAMQQATNYTLYQAAPLFFKVFSAVVAMLIINLIYYASKASILKRYRRI